MSDTPKTDTAAFQIISQLQSGTVDVVPAEFARQLERELNECREANRSQQNNYTLLCNAVFGGGNCTLDWKDPVEIAKKHREVFESVFRLKPKAMNDKEAS